MYIEEEPVDVASFGWIKEDAQVRSWLWNSIEPQISCDVMLLPTDYAAWKSVYENLGTDKSIQRVHDVCEEVFFSKQGNKTFSE